MMARPHDAAPGARKAGALPLGEAFQPTVDRLREIAARSGDTLFLAEGPPHPDHELLGLCADVLALTQRINGARQYRDAVVDASPCRPVSQDVCAELDASLRAQLGLEAARRQLLRRAGKLRATTPAGIYAKALAVRSSTTGAAILAHTLADELIACDALRRSLWPAEGV